MTRAHGNHRKALTTVISSLRVLLLITFCALIVPKNVPQKVVFDHVFVEFGKNLGTLVAKRIFHHLQSVEECSVRDITSLTTKERNILIESNPKRSLILALGNSSISLEFIPPAECSSLEPESFRIVSNPDIRGFIVLASNGRPLDALTHRNVSFNKDIVHYGAVVGAYASLELLGAYKNLSPSYLPNFNSYSHTKHL